MARAINSRVAASTAPPANLPILGSATKTG